MVSELLGGVGLKRDRTLLLGGHSGYEPLPQLYAFVDTQVALTFKAYVFFLRHQLQLGGAAGVVVIGAFAFGWFLVRRRRRGGTAPG